MTTTKDTMKESLGLLETTADNFAEFAIDSDDEMEMEIPLDPPSSSSLSKESIDSSAPQPSNGTGISGSAQLEKVNMNDDPLTALVSATEKVGATAAKTLQSNVEVNMLYANDNLPTNQAIYPSFPTHAHNPNSQSVSQSLSSTFSSFATKFQDAVSNATRTSPLPTVVPNDEKTVSDGGLKHEIQSNLSSNNYVERSIQNNNSNARIISNNVIQNSPSYTSVSSNSTSVYSSNAQNEFKSQSIYQIGSTSTVNDHSLKSMLITSAVGELLPGERVIVFLSHLLQVRDSSSPQTSIGSSLFHCKEFSQSPSNQSNDAQNTQHLSHDIENWVKSASVSSLYQHAHLSCKRANGKHHYVVQMPLASVERIEKSTDFGLNSSTGISNQMGFGAAANLMSGNADSIGGSVARGTLIVYGKDNGRFIQFSAPSYADCMRVYESLNTYAFPGRRNLGYLFAFESRRAEVMDSTKSSEESMTVGAQNGSMRLTARATPKRYDAISEFRRMMSGSKEGQLHPDCPWTPVLRANATYNLCSSYPSVIFAPRTINDEKPEGMRLLRDTASFRSGGRMQTLSWASKFDGASIWRSAQPKVGLQGNRSPADELFMKRIAESAALANSQAAVKGQMPPRPSLPFLKMLTGGINESDLLLDIKDGGAFNERCMLKIFDLRPKSSAMANRTAGYGYENTSHYKNTTLSFFGIGNIHAVRDSYKKLSSLCASLATNDVQWMQLVEDTKWLSLVRLILSASWQVAFHVKYNRLPVLVHCSHGWDRTSQVSALAQIFLDPYYRTRIGFSCLIEKDFLSLGHPFHTRCGHGEGRGSDQGGSGSSSGNGDDISPIFLQFLDCVFQIVNQYPDYFEFNTKYLLLLSEHIYSCRFGTLLCDTEREREIVASIRQRTYCLWEHLDSCPDLVNTKFPSNDILEGNGFFNGEGCLLMPLSSLLRNVTLWSERHCMHSAKPTFRNIPMSFYPNDLTDDRLSQPLFESKDVESLALRASSREVEKWKKIAQQKDEEISKLRQQLKDANRHERM